MHMRRYRPGDRLRPFALFSGCRRDQLADSDGLFTELRLPDGRALTRVGDAGWEVFLIKRGTVEVTRENRTIARLGPGDVVGEMALLGGRPRAADAHADGPIDVLVQGTKDFDALLDLVPLVAERLERMADGRRLGTAS